MTAWMSTKSDSAVQLIGIYCLFASIAALGFQLFEYLVPLLISTGIELRVISISNLVPRRFIARVSDFADARHSLAG